MPQGREGGDRDEFDEPVAIGVGDEGEMARGIQVTRRRGYWTMTVKSAVTLVNGTLQPVQFHPEERVTVGARAVSSVSGFSRPSVRGSAVAYGQRWARTPENTKATPSKACEPSTPSATAAGASQPGSSSATAS